MSAATDTFLKVAGLRKAYGPTVAVADVSFTVAAGSIVGLVGQNGAGKSTVIRILAGVVKPEAGTIYVDGAPVTIGSARAARQLGFAFMHQELSDFPRLSVAENIALHTGLPKRPWGPVAWSTLYRRAEAVIQELGHELDPKAETGSLSVADRRIVMIGAALYANARLLVLDERSASLTAADVTNLHRVLRAARGRGVAVMYVSHRLDEVVALCDKAIVMRDGREVAEHQAGTALSHESLVAEITGRPRNRGTSEAMRVAPILRSDPRRDAPRGDVPLVRAVSLGGGRVRDVSLEIGAGEVVGLGGLVGSGRTEVAWMIAGAARPSTGELFVRGHPATFRSPSEALDQGIALLPEDRRNQALIGTFGIRQNITIASLSRVRRSRVFVAPSARREREVARDYMRLLSIKARHPDESVRRLSGGNQQKVVVARWLMRDPDVLLFDEPTAGIDVSGKQEIYGVIRDLAARGKGVLLIASELSELVTVCHRVVVLREGRNVAELIGREITEEAILEECFGLAAL